MKKAEIICPDCGCKDFTFKNSLHCEETKFKCGLTIIRVISNGYIEIYKECKEWKK